MLEIIFLIIIFITGIYFGSFFTLATYRLPKKENITHKHSYCPNCNHKLGVFDLVPIFSYLFLRGKCRYCGKKIGIRYFLFELLTGIVFVLFAISLNKTILDLDFNTIIYFALTILYFASLFIIAGIEKEKNVIQKSVLIYGVIVAILYMIYSYTLNPNNVYEYVIYLLMMIILLFMDIIFLKKKMKYNYTVQILILILYMLIFSGAYNTTFTVCIAILSIGIKKLISFLTKKKSKVINNKEKVPFAFFLCTANILVIIITNFIINYTISK